MAQHYFYNHDQQTKSFLLIIFIKVETLEEDITEVFDHEFGMAGEQFVFPRVKTMGTKNVTGNRERSGSFMAEYFGQLTNSKILGLYELYKTDFILFDYRIEEFLH